MEHLFNNIDYTRTLGSKVSRDLYVAYKKNAQSNKITLSEAVRISLITQANSWIASTNETSNSQQESITHPSFNYTATSKSFYSQSNSTKPLYYKEFLDEANRNRVRMQRDVNTLFEVGMALFI